MNTNLINVLKSANICQPIPNTVLTSKKPEILGSIVGQKKPHLLESLLIQEHQPDLNIDCSSIPVVLNLSWFVARFRRPANFFHFMQRTEESIS